MNKVIYDKLTIYFENPAYKDYSNPERWSLNNIAVYRVDV